MVQMYSYILKQKKSFTVADDLIYMELILQIPCMMAEVMNKAMQHPISTALYDGSLDCENGKMLEACDKLVTQQTKSDNSKI